jgi:putative ABC transport system permease protein
MRLFPLAYRSLLNRRATAALTVLAIALSVTLLLGVERIRLEARTSFGNTVSGTDLIVGARGGSIQLLLYAVFRVGNATNDISWSSYSELAADPAVAWTIPISLGDSHRGFRVLGTTDDYFRYFRFGERRPLSFESGAPFADVFDAVLGADVARTLGYKLGDRMIVTHGIGTGGLSQHNDKPFRVAGILAKTGTPVDRTIHVSLAGIEAIHIDWRGGARVPGFKFTAEDVRKMALQPKTVTAFLVGLKSRLGAFKVLRRINAYEREPLTAILPGVALHELWSLLGTAETALSAISYMVLGTSLLGMLTMMLAGVNERRREMAILRSVGARSRHIFLLFVCEALVLTMTGIALGLALMYGGLFAVQPFIEAQYGLYIPITAPGGRDGMFLALIMGAGLIAGAAPAYRAYRQSLADGMAIRT